MYKPQIEKHFSGEDIYRIYRGSDPRFFANFGHVESGADYKGFMLDETDDFDRAVLAEHQKKDDEIVLRAYTQRMHEDGLFCFVKLSLSRHLVYFTKPVGFGDETVEFEKRGVQLKYLNLKK